MSTPLSGMSAARQRFKFIEVSGAFIPLAVFCDPGRRLWLFFYQVHSTLQHGHDDTLEKKSPDRLQI